jgi:hypothetical protein
MNIFPTVGDHGLHPLSITSNSGAKELHIKSNRIQHHEAKHGTDKKDDEKGFTYEGRAHVGVLDRIGVYAIDHHTEQVTQ